MAAYILTEFNNYRNLETTDTLRRYHYSPLGKIDLIGDLMRPWDIIMGYLDISQDWVET